MRWPRKRDIKSIGIEAYEGNIFFSPCDSSTSGLVDMERFPFVMLGSISSISEVISISDKFMLITLMQLSYPIISPIPDIFLCKLVKDFNSGFIITCQRQISLISGLITLWYTNVKLYILALLIKNLFKLYWKNHVYSSTNSMIINKKERSSYIQHLKSRYLISKDLRIWDLLILLKILERVTKTFND